MAGTDDLEVVNNEADGRFEVRVGDDVAYAEYRLLKTGILFPHTEVPAAFEGKGVGGKLVRAAMAFARRLLVRRYGLVSASINQGGTCHSTTHP